SSSEVYGDYDGIMSENVMDERPIRQMNDYAISKWVNEQQIMNAAEQWGGETVRVRLFNVYGPGERFSPYRSAIVRFCHSAIHHLPFTVHSGHERTSLYIDDCIEALTSIATDFRAGQVYNLAG